MFLVSNGVVYKIAFGLYFPSPCIGFTVIFIFKVFIFIFGKLISTEIVDKTERLYELKEIVKKFHPVNYDVFKYVITHLNRYYATKYKFE